MAENQSSPGTETNSANAGNGHSKSQTSARPARSRAATRSGNPKSSSASEEAMKKQIAELRREVSRLNRALAEQAEDAVETAHGWYDSVADRASDLYGSATGRASRAAKQLRTQAHSVSETVQQNPGTISTAMMLGGRLGVPADRALSRTAEPYPDWFQRRWTR